MIFVKPYCVEFVTYSEGFCYRDASGKFPDYPAEEEGGSGAIFKEKDPAEIEAELKAKVCEQTLLFDLKELSIDILNSDTQLNSPLALLLKNTGKRLCRVCMYQDLLVF